MAGELNIINDDDLKAPLELAANYKKLANDFDAVVASTTLLVNKLESQDATIAELTSQTKQLEKEVKRLEKANKSAAKSAEGMAAATELADEATGGFITRVKTLSKQLWALVANPVVATIAAIGVALLSVATYFKQTNEGADKFEKLMNGLKGVLDFLTNKFAALGEQIVKLFEDGNVVGELFMAVFKRILNVIVGVIDTFTNLLRIVNTLSKYNLKEILTGKLKPEDVKELNSAFKDLGKSALAAMTGIGGAADDVNKKLVSLNKLTEESQQLGDELRNRILSKAEAELQIEKLLFQAKDKTHNSDEQRLEALKQAVAISQEQLKIDLDHAVRKERSFTADLLHNKDIIKSEQEANAVLKQGTTILQDQLLEQKASDVQLEERKKLQAEIINLQRAFFAENKKAVQQISALEKEITDEKIKQAEIELKARLRIYDEQLAKSKETSGRELVGVQSALEQEKTLRKNFGERLIEDSKAREEARKEQEKRYTEMLKAEEEKRRLIRETGLRAVEMVGNEIFSRRQDKLAEEEKAIEERRAKDLAAAGDDERKKLAINRKADREQARIKTKQAQADKSAAMFGIIINTALGIMKAAPVVPLMIATGIIGALQLALVASKPIPKFWMGTDSTPDTFIAGDRGRELVRYNGKMMMADRPTMFTGMEGAQVFKNHDTEEILGDINDVGYALNYGSRIRRQSAKDVAIAETLRENNKWLKRIAEKEEADFIVDEEGFRRYSSKLAKKNARIEKRFGGR